MKSALGRNLGSLMGSNNAPGTMAGVTVHVPAPKPGAGVRTLLRGQTSQAARGPHATTAPPQAIVPRWYYFAADVLIAGLALLLVWRRPITSDWKAALLLAGLMTMGIILAIAGLCQTEDETRS